MGRRPQPLVVNRASTTIAHIWRKSPRSWGDQGGRAEPSGLLDRLSRRRLPLSAAGLGQGDRRRGGDVQRADPAELGYVGDRVGRGQQRGRAAAILVTQRQAYVTGERRLVQRYRAVGQLDRDDC